jgi:hypothetical protein
MQEMMLHTMPSGCVVGCTLRWQALRPRQIAQPNPQCPFYPTVEEKYSLQSGVERATVRLQTLNLSSSLQGGHVERGRWAGMGEKGWEGTPDPMFW